MRHLKSISQSSFSIVNWLLLLLFVFVLILFIECTPQCTQCVLYILYYFFAHTHYCCCCVLDFVRIVVAVSFFSFSLGRSTTFNRLAFIRIQVHTTFAASCLAFNVVERVFSLSLLLFFSVSSIFILFHLIEMFVHVCSVYTVHSPRRMCARTSVCMCYKYNN